MSAVISQAMLHKFAGASARRVVAAGATPVRPARWYRSARLWLVMTALWVGAGCGKDASGSEVADTTADGTGPAAAPTQAQAGDPPFAVAGELDGLLLVWFDSEGLHTAQNRSEIPEAQRAVVRIDSLNVAPQDRLDPEQVYFADLRAPGADGSYPVQKAQRGWFDAQVDRMKPAPAVDEATGSGIVMYKASWCGVCRSASAYLKSRHVPFVEKDVEKEPGASEEMMRKAQSKGLRPQGVPVIDFQGEIMLGFDKQRLGVLIDRFGKTI